MFANLLKNHISIAGGKRASDNSENLFASSLRHVISLIVRVTYGGVNNNVFCHKKEGALAGSLPRLRSLDSGDVVVDGLRVVLVRALRNLAAQDLTQEH